MGLELGFTRQARANNVPFRDQVFLQTLQPFTSGMEEPCMLPILVGLILGRTDAAFFHFYFPR